MVSQNHPKRVAGQIPTPKCTAEPRAAFEIVAKNHEEKKLKKTDA